MKRLLFLTPLIFVSTPSAQDYYLNGNSMAGTFTKTVVADINGNFYPDVVYLAGDELNAILDPGIFGLHYSAVATGILDVDALPVGAPGEQADLVALTAAGVELLTWDETSDPTFTSTVIDGGAWMSPFLVAAAPTAPGAPREVVGFTQNGTLRHLTETASGPWIDAQLLATPLTVTDLAVADLGTGTGNCVAALTTSGIALVDISGASVLMYTSLGPTKAMTVLGGPGGDRVGVVTGNASTDRFRIVGPSGLESTTTLAADTDVVAMAAGDFGPASDGYDDPLLSYQFEHSLTALLSTAGQGSASYSAGNTEYFDLQIPGEPLNFNLIGPATGNVCTPGVGDFDQDGDDDICFPIQSTGTVLVYRGTRIDAEVFKPTIVEQSIEGCGSDTFLELKIEHRRPSAAVPYMRFAMYAKPDPTSDLIVQPEWMETINGDDYASVDPGTPNPGDEVYTYGVSIQLNHVEGPQDDEPIECGYFDEIFVMVLTSEEQTGGETTRRHPGHIYLFENGAGTAGENFVNSHSATVVPLPVKCCDGDLDNGHAGCPPCLPGGTTMGAPKP